MLISLCVPCMNRLHDLKRAIPSWIKAANASPPVEIAVLDYSSSDNLERYFLSVREGNPLDILSFQNRLMYNRDDRHDYYHMTHAYNLAVRLSSGEYVVVMGADAILAENYIIRVREFVAQGCIWMRGQRFKGIIAIQRQEFIDAGGYDERLEFYSGEDKELEQRLQRRGVKPCLMPDGLVHTLRTSKADKLANFRLPLTKRQMMERGSRIRAENVAEGVMVANEGREWGQW